MTDATVLLIVLAWIAAITALGYIGNRQRFRPLLDKLPASLKEQRNMSRLNGIKTLDMARGGVQPTRAMYDDLLKLAEGYKADIADLQVVCRAQSRTMKKLEARIKQLEHEAKPF